MPSFSQHRWYEGGMITGPIIFQRTLHRMGMMFRSIVLIQNSIEWAINGLVESTISMDERGFSGHISNPSIFTLMNTSRTHSFWYNKELIFYKIDWFTFHVQYIIRTVESVSSPQKFDPNDSHQHFASAPKNRKYLRFSFFDVEKKTTTKTFAPNILNFLNPEDYCCSAKHSCWLLDCVMIS